LKLARNSLTKGAGALSALLLAASCNQILGNQAPGGDGTGGMGGGGAPSDSGGTSTGGSGHSGGTTGSGGADGGCANGTFDHDADPDTACQSWSKCQPGQYISEQGTPTSDRSCKACTTGTFSDGQNAAECAEWVDCEPGEYVTASGTKEDDRQCEACADDEYSTEENADACSQLTDCGHPWKTAEVGTPVSNAECRSGIRQFGTDENEARAFAALDPSGNMIVAGGTEGALVGENAGALDAYVRKYDDHGQLVWEQQFGTIGNDEIFDVAVSGSGEAYIVGSTTATLPGGTWSGAETDAFIMKFSSAGSRLWTQQFRLVAEPLTSNFATSVAVDDSGNAYVAGTTDGGSAKGNYLRKFDSSGGHLWTSDLTVPVAASVGFTDPYVTVDEGDHAYLVWGVINGGYVVKVEKHASDATDETAAWTAEFSSSTAGASVIPFGVAAFGGHVYVAGSTEGVFFGTSNAGGQDAYLARVDGLNDVPWIRQFGTVAEDVARDVTVDESGLIYVVGRTQGDLVGTNGGGNDLFLGQYDDTGDPQWTRQWGTDVDDVPGSVTAHDEGNAFVAGSTTGDLDGDNAGAGDFFVMLVEPP
jgi:hypothetical protein